MFEENTFYFKIHGKVSGLFQNEGEATDYLYNLLVGKCEFQIDSVDEEKDDIEVVNHERRL